jgi:hypothetical protein
MNAQTTQERLEELRGNIVCQTCGKKWDTISPCALCNATRAAAGMVWPGA